MAKAVTCYEDNAKNLHRKLEDAIAADIAALLGDKGKGDGMAIGIAKALIANREGVEQSFADLDRLTANQKEK